MKRLILSVLAVFAIATAVVGCSSSNTTGPTPTLTSGNTELEGTWTAATEGMTLTFSGNNWTFTRSSLQISGTFTINSAASPKTIDRYVTTSSVPQYVGKTSLGIYLLSGTNLTFVGLEPGNATRPTSFDMAVVLVKQ